MESSMMERSEDEMKDIPRMLNPGGLLFAMANASASWNCDGCGGATTFATGPIMSNNLTRR